MSGFCCPDMFVRLKKHPWAFSSLGNMEIHPETSHRDNEEPLPASNVRETDAAAVHKDPFPRSC